MIINEVNILCKKIFCDGDGRILIWKQWQRFSRSLCCHGNGDISTCCERAGDESRCILMVVLQSGEGDNLLQYWPQPPLNFLYTFWCFVLLLSCIVEEDSVSDDGHQSHHKHKVLALGSNGTCICETMTASPLTQYLNKTKSVIRVHALPQYFLSLSQIKDGLPTLYNIHHYCISCKRYTMKMISRAAACKTV